MEKDRKGLISFSNELGTKFIWDIYKIPIDEQIFKWNKFSGNFQQPTLLKAIVSLPDTIGDTYLDLSQFNKGY